MQICFAGLLVFSNLLTFSASNPAVPVYVNKAWSVDNPVETYRVYDFPFCKPVNAEDALMSLGQILRGDRLTTSLYSMPFNIAKSNVTLCEKTLTADELTKFMSAIRRRYVFEMYIGGLPVVVPFGSSLTAGEYSLCTSVSFSISHKVDKVVALAASCTSSEKLDPGRKEAVKFSYSVAWKERADLDADDSWWFQQAQLANVMSYVKTGTIGGSISSQSNLSIHWMSILNSLILALMIFSLVLLILVRIVRADLSKFLPEDGVELGEEHDASANWKLLHGDIFRPPAHRMWLCAAVGAGTQLLFVFATLLFIGAVADGVFSHSGGLVSAGVVLYMLSAAIAGFVSARLYHRIGGVKWRWNMLVTSLFFTGPAFAVWAILNTVAIAYNSTAAFPFVTILQLFTMWCLVTIPLTVIGGTVGRQRAATIVKQQPFPVRTNRIPREVPKPDSVVSYSVVQYLVCGFLAFMSIYLELKFVFKSVWSSGQFYTLFGILIVAIALLFMLAGVLTVLFTYFQLNAEDYRWWWRSLVSGGSVALYIYAFAVYYYVTSDMSGGMQSAFFFLYSALIAYAVGLAVGAVSFATTYNFVWYIYNNVKSD